MTAKVGAEHVMITMWQQRLAALAVTALFAADGMEPIAAQRVGRRPETASARGLRIPASATVLTLTGLNFNLTSYMPRQFGGVFSRSPYVMREVHYPASIAPHSIDRGVLALDAALRDTAGPVIVLAHSQGAQVASRWMRAHTLDPSAPEIGRVTFILTGNPLRAEGGRAIGRREIGGAIGLPTPLAPWHVIDVARQYDGWADWPADATDKAAICDARAGMRRYHPHYEDVDLNARSNLVSTRGATTFVRTREKQACRRLGR